MIAMTTSSSTKVKPWRPASFPRFALSTFRVPQNNNENKQQGRRLPNPAEKRISRSITPQEKEKTTKLREKLGMKWVRKSDSFGLR